MNPSERAEPNHGGRRSVALIGTLFGAMPGTGPTITTFVAYALEQKPRAPASCLITR